MVLQLLNLTKNHLGGNDYGKVHDDLVLYEYIYFLNQLIIQFFFISDVEKTLNSSTYMVNIVPPRILKPK